MGQYAQGDPLGRHRQAAVQEKTSQISLPDGAESLCFAMQGKVKNGGILHG